MTIQFEIDRVMEFTKQLQLASSGKSNLYTPMLCRNIVLMIANPSIMHAYNVNKL